MANSKQSARSNGPRLAGVLHAAGMTAHAVAICVLAYYACLRLVDASGIVLYHMGMVWFDAAVTASMAGFVYLLIILLWVFSRRGVWRQWMAMAVLTALAVAAAWLLGGNV